VAPFFRREQFEKPLVIEAMNVRIMCFDGLARRRGLLGFDVIVFVEGLIVVTGFSSVTSSLVLVVRDGEKPESADSNLSGDADSEQPSSSRSDVVNVAEPDDICSGMFSSQSATAPG
jgi:hypothetical protein